MMRYLVPLVAIACAWTGAAGLIPAFHAAMDQGLSDGHDDPQNFSLDDFDAALGRVLQGLQ